LPLLTPDGGPGLETALEALRLHELHRWVGRFFRALKVGARIEDPRPDRADALRKRFAFDAVTASCVWNLCRPARARPDDPAGRHVPAGHLEMVRILYVSRRIRGSRVSPAATEIDVRTFVVMVAGQAGFRSSKGSPAGAAEAVAGVQFPVQGRRRVSVDGRDARLPGRGLTASKPLGDRRGSPAAASPRRPDGLLAP